MESAETLFDTLVRAEKGKIKRPDLDPEMISPKVNSISVNSNQMYFALGTEAGFEIISNDASCA